MLVEVEVVHMLLQLLVGLVVEVQVVEIRRLAVQLVLRVLLI
jgi:hypothetical protein